VVNKDDHIHDNKVTLQYGRGRPLSLTLSFIGEIPWFDVRVEIQRCDWSKNAFFCMCPVWFPRLWVILSQSQRCISPRTSNHGISPNDSVTNSVSDSGWPLRSICYVRPNNSIHLDHTLTPGNVNALQWRSTGLWFPTFHQHFDTKTRRPSGSNVM